ncbi:hypothetical protein D5W64_12595 [Salmonella enterica subsp. enterica serovar Saintpaul]|nr:hypothetical protein [Salmonella enterica subsp. enterica serovar Saintpaul]
MSAPQPAVEIRTSAHRKGIDRLIVDFAVLLNRGGYPAHVALASLVNKSKNVTKLIGQKYNSSNGVISIEFEIEPSTDPDVLVKHAVQVELSVADEPGFAPASYTGELGCEELPPVVSNVQGVWQDRMFSLTGKVVRANGKIPDTFEIGKATNLKGITRATPIHQRYHKYNGYFIVDFLADDVELVADVGLTVVGSTDKAQAEFTYNSELPAIRNVDTKVVSAILKDKILNVALDVRYTLSGQRPLNFDLKSPLTAGTNLPSGIPELIEPSYDPVSGIYQFGIRVNTVPEGKLDYELSTKALPDNNPESVHSLSISYVHQADYSVKLLNVIINGDRLIGHFKASQKGVKDYQLKYFDQGKAELTLGVKGNARPKVSYLPNKDEFQVEWEIDDFPTNTTRYDIRGHFIFDGKKVPYMIKRTVNPVTIWSESINRIDGLHSGYKFLVLSKDEVVDVDCSGLQVLVNKHPSGLTLTQHTNEDPAIVSGHFPLTPPEENSVDIVVLGTVNIVTDVIRKLPVRIEGTDFIPLPEEGDELDLTVESHSHENGIDTVLLSPRFLNDSIPANVKVVPGSLMLNGNPLGNYKDVWSKGVLVVKAACSATGFKETHVITGKLELPGYRTERQYEFSTTLEIGSDYFPVEYVIKDTVYLNENLVTNVSVRLKNGEIPDNVEVVDELVGPGIHKSSSIYNPKDGIITLTNKCVEPGLAGKLYKTMPVLSVSKDKDVTSKILTIKHFEPAPLQIKAVYIGYETKGTKIQITHLIDSNRPYPKSLTPTTEVDGFKYDPVQGKITYLVSFVDVDRPSTFTGTFECKMDETLETLKVNTGPRWRAPKAAATYLNHYFKDGQLIYQWIFRDASDGIPKSIRIDDYWKHNVNVVARDIVLDYDRTTGIGQVIVKASYATDKKYFAEAKFRFPTPDVNYYPLVIKA